ncbi:hypothetical protein OROMI_024175 [Orobanche minor]
MAYDHRDNRLHHQLCPHHTHRCHSDADLRGAVSRSYTDKKKQSNCFYGIHNLRCEKEGHISAKRSLREKTIAALAPRKPKNSVVSSSLKVDDIFRSILISTEIGSEDFSPFLDQICRR